MNRLTDSVSQSVSQSVNLVSQSVSQLVNRLTDSVSQSVSQSIQVLSILTWVRVRVEVRGLRVLLYMLSIKLIYHAYA